MIAFSECLLNEREYAGAVRILEEHWASTRRSARALTILGLANMEMGRSADAHDALAQAHELEPDDIDISSHLAQVLFQRAVEVSPAQADARESVLGQPCRIDSGLPRREAMKLTRALIAEAKSLTHVLITRTAGEPNLRIQYEFQMMDLNELNGRPTSRERRIELLDRLRHLVDQTGDRAAQEMLVYRLINAANSAEVVDLDPVLAASLTELALTYADTPELQRIVNQMTTYGDSRGRAGRPHPSLAGLVSQPCVLGVPME